MKGFKLITPDHQEIRFEFYLDTAPVTSAAFARSLPFTRVFFHAGRGHDWAHETRPGKDGQLSWYLLWRRERAR